MFYLCPIKVINHKQKHRVMNQYTVAIALIIGCNYESNSPKLETKYFDVQANNDYDAIEKAKKLETSRLSVWDCWIA